MRPLRAVHQFHPGTSKGDAITNHMLALQGELQRMGYQSFVFANQIDRALTERVRPFTQLDDPEALLIVHHSIGYSFFDQVVALPNPIVTNYHNITPERFEDNAAVRSLLRLGHEQVETLAQRSLLGIAASNFNRREMLAVGFEAVDVLPVQFDLAEFTEVGNQGLARSSDWLFVGRMVPSKCQLELVRAFAHYRHTFAPDACLHLVGDSSRTPYVQAIRAEAGRLGVASHVVVHGKVNETELRESFATAGVYVSFSEHEGFGVPLLEAMAAGLPVIAFASTAVPETMGGAGLLLHSKDPVSTAAVAWAVLEDAALRKRLVDVQHQRIRRLEEFDTPSLLRRVLRRAAGVEVPRTLQIQGPFETSYSLALLNRQLALGLDHEDRWSVSIHATEGPGDYQPRAEDLAQHPQASVLYAKGKHIPYPDIAIRQMYPPRVNDTTGGLTFQYFGWEESRIPTEMAAQFNQFLDGIGAMSNFVADTLRSSGVSVPISVVGVGVTPPDPDATIEAPELGDLDQLEAVRFLHVSSAFPRKGVDVLLRAYFATFSAADDVTLILKSFPNIHNETGRQLAELRATHPHPPSVRWIDRELDDVELDGLYNLATVYVHAARGEGFGLPVAEAMAACIPVIAPASTGMADIVSERTATTIPFSMQPASSHLSVADSQWAEPDQAALSAALRALADDPRAPHVVSLAAEAKRRILEQYSWTAVTERWSSFILDIEERLRPERVALVTTWNSKCGISEYSRYLVQGAGATIDFSLMASRRAELIDPWVDGDVERVWIEGGPDISGLAAALLASDDDVVHVQHNFGFYPFAALEELLIDLLPHRGVVITLHRTEDYHQGDDRKNLRQMERALRVVDAVIVHKQEDAERLAELGITENVRVLPHGNLGPPQETPEAVRRALGFGDRPVIGTFGFLLPHKGTLELIRTVGRLRDEFPDIMLLATCASYPAAESDEYRVLVEAEISSLGLEGSVILVTDFLTDDQMRLLLRGCDVIVLPYDETPESESGALRTVLPIGRPVAVTNRRIFANAYDAVAVIDPDDPQGIDSTIRRILTDQDERDRLAVAAQQFSDATRWERVAADHRRIYRQARAQRDDRRGRAASDQP